MSWNEEKVNKLKELWGKGNTASQIAEIIGGISRNAVIGKAHRLNLSAKIKTRAATSNKSFENSSEHRDIKGKKGKIDIDIDAISGATQPYVNYNKSGYPVINITQYAASQFSKWLTAKTGNYYRLPTEAEWEYACRSGNQKAYSFGNKSKKTKKKF